VKAGVNKVLILLQSALKSSFITTLLFPELPPFHARPPSTIARIDDSRRNTRRPTFTRWIEPFDISRSNVGIEIRRASTASWRVSSRSGCAVVWLALSASAKLAAVIPAQYGESMVAAHTAIGSGITSVVTSFCFMA
jgi:hypothetical protein